MTNIYIDFEHLQYADIVGYSYVKMFVSKNVSIRCHKDVDCQIYCVCFYII